MTIEQLRRAHRAQPFEPFALHLADGRKIDVAHPEFLAEFASGRTVIVTLPDDTWEVIDLLLVTSLHVGNGQTRAPTQ
jgi:hypothetical protein